MGYETVDIPIPTLRGRTPDEPYTEFEGLEVARQGRIIPCPEGTTIAKHRQRISSRSVNYGRRNGQKFAVHIIKHNGQKKVAIWRKE